ncbi:macrosialin [Rhinatrema bivittatum]|uniref:macrosialin n=1 Tax=Rhinatrema bivittatum TaxID=194408 RepID=UPI00112E3ADD|nr:macrosialin [Rhinatrema bivittatum]
MEKSLLLWFFSQAVFSSAQMDQQCCPGKKSATLVPAFTVTPTTSHTTAPLTTNHTTAPLTTNHTTAHSTTNHTTAPLTTNHTTAPLTTNHTTATTSSHSTLTPTSNPNAVGDYSVSVGSETCLRVVMAIKLHVQYNTTKQLWGTFPVPVPPLSSPSGNCTNQTATLQLSFAEGHLHFTFQKNVTSKVFYMSKIQVNLNHSFSGTSQTHVQVENSNLHEYETPLGRSYTCKDTKIDVSRDVIMEAIQEQVQAFSLKGGQFSEADQCPADTVNLVVPIVISMVLIVLVAIVIIAYLIGRKRAPAGYQSI